VGVPDLTGEIDDAYKLVGTLTDQQRQAAIRSDRRGNITTGPGQDGNVPEPTGISCATFSDEQKKVLLGLISQWINIHPPRQAEQRMKQVAAEIDKTHFAWRGGTTPGSEMSYIIQGPTLIIEYASQGNQDHLHTMYRDPTDEYGGQLEDK